MKRRALIPIFFCMIFMTSCGIIDRLGFDTYDYMSEPITKVHETDGEKAELIIGLLDVIVTDSTSLSMFERMNEAINAYRDTVLLYMLETEYSKYSGNTDLIAKAMKEYPEYTISQIIPVSDFEATMYRYFGGSVKITHKDGARFKYLSKIGAYISPTTTESEQFYAELTELSETEKTYRVKFIVTNGEVKSGEYFALIIKRDDGTLYFKKVLAAA